MNNWTPYQPARARDKKHYDIMLRNGEVVECCWPNGIHWNPMKASKHNHIADYRVTHIRLCAHPIG